MFLCDCAGFALEIRDCVFENASAGTENGMAGEEGGTARFLAARRFCP